MGAGEVTGLDAAFSKRVYKRHQENIKNKKQKERKKAIETETSKKAGEEGKSCLPGH